VLLMAAKQTLEAAAAPHLILGKRGERQYVLTLHCCVDCKLNTDVLQQSEHVVTSTTL
jgi:hypothetical protein